MSINIPSSSQLTAVLPSGVARSYTGRGFLRTGADKTGDTASLRPGSTWRTVSHQNRQKAILEDLRVRSTRLSEALGLFEVPDQANMSRTRVAFSSRPDYFTGRAEDGAETGRHYVQVLSRAWPQTNTGDKLAAESGAETGTASYAHDDEIEGEVGRYEFELEINGETRTVAVDHISSGLRKDSNRDLLERIGRQIESADSRLEAEVESNRGVDENSLPIDEVQLVIRSRTSGSDVAFSLSDTTGDLVERLGLERTAPVGSQARVSFDHQVYISPDNTASVEGGDVSLTLYGETNPDETLEIKSGVEAVVGQTEVLLERYNEYVDFLLANRDVIKPTIHTDLLSTAESKRRVLMEIGLAPQALGRVELTDRFAQILGGEPEKAAEALTGEDGFFTGVVEDIDNFLDNNMMQYANELPAPTPIYEGRAKYVEALREGLGLSILA